MELSLYPQWAGFLVGDDILSGLTDVNDYLILMASRHFFQHILTKLIQQNK